MAIEPQFRKAIDAQWSFQAVDESRRLVAFPDLSVSKITAWKWDFGDGTSSAEQNPVHQYASSRDYVVVLDVEGPGREIAPRQGLGCCDKVGTGII